MTLFPPCKQFSDDIYTSVQKLERKKQLKQQYDADRDNLQISLSQLHQEARKEDSTAFVKTRDALVKKLQNTRIKNVEADGLYVCLQKMQKTPAEIDALKFLAQ